MTQIWWYLARASGIVAWLLLTASVLWGIFLSTKLLQGLRRPAWLLDLHRWLGGLTVAFVGLHVASLIADSYVSFDLVDVLVPFASSWRPGAVALGVAAMWGLVAVELTSLAMRRLPRSVWRAVHLTSYLVFWATSLHAALAGTDTASPLYIWTAVGSIIAVVFALTYRVLAGRGARARLDRPTSTAHTNTNTNTNTHTNTNTNDPTRPLVRSRS